MQSSIDDLTFKLVPQFGDREARNVAKILAEYFEESPSIAKNEIDQILKRILKGEPVQYVVGHTWFYGRRFEVTPDVLIPRPETEELVFWILEDWNNKGPVRMLDIGTGSGCIPITLNLEMDRVDFIATDISVEALSIARINASKHAVNPMFIESDVLQDGFDDMGKQDVVVSNPPYVSFVEFENLDPAVRNFEPRIALGHKSGDPLLFYRVIAEGALLNPGGAIYVELNEFHALEIEEIFKNQGYRVELKNDMQGKVRMLKAVAEVD